jgi:hypothetical protein
MDAAATHLPRIRQHRTQKRVTTVDIPTSSPQTTPPTFPATRRPLAIPVPRQLLVWLSVGVAGTVLFLVIYLIEGATRPGYNAWQQTISSLSSGPSGWIQRANFIMCGVSVIWLALVWRQILQGGVGARWYPVVHGIEGAGLIGVGIFILDPLHTICLMVTVSAMSVGLFVIAWRFWKTPYWRGWATFTVACGLWPMVFMPFFGIALNPHSALSPYAGLIERLATSPDIVWGAVMLIPLWAGRTLMQPNA